MRRAGQASVDYETKINQLHEKLRNTETKLKFSQRSNLQTREKVHRVSNDLLSAENIETVTNSVRNEQIDSLSKELNEALFAIDEIENANRSQNKQHELAEANDRVAQKKNILSEKETKNEEIRKEIKRKYEENVKKQSSLVEKISAIKKQIDAKEHMMSEIPPKKRKWKQIKKKILFLETMQNLDSKINQMKEETERMEKRREEKEKEAILFISQLQKEKSNVNQIKKGN